MSSQRDRFDDVVVKIEHSIDDRDQPIPASLDSLNETDLAQLKKSGALILHGGAWCWSRA